MPARDPDQLFEGSFREPPYFEDLTERGALKLTSLMRFAGRPHFALWQEKIGGDRFRDEAGQYIPIFHLELEVLDVSIESREPLRIDVEIRLGREAGVAGRPPRLVSEGRTRVWAPTPSGPREVGGTRKLAIFAHLDPARGKVTALHPMLDMGDRPEREITLPHWRDLLRPPEGFVAQTEGWAFEDGEPRVWSYQQTDPNRHIHAMEYPRMLDLFVTEELARRGRAATSYVFSRAEIFFARPCHTGERYLRRATPWRAPDGREIVLGAIYKVDDDGRVDEDRPANLCWLHPRSPQDARGGFLGRSEER